MLVATSDRESGAQPDKLNSFAPSLPFRSVHSAMQPVSGNWAIDSTALVASAAMAERKPLLGVAAIRRPINKLSDNFVPLRSLSHHFPKTFQAFAIKSASSGATRTSMSHPRLMLHCSRGKDVLLCRTKRAGATTIRSRPAKRGRPDRAILASSPGLTRTDPMRARCRPKARADALSPGPLTNEVTP